MDVATLAARGRRSTLDQASDAAGRYLWEILHVLPG
jgi:hypothetical protein